MSIIEVAKVAGVSKTTVSRVINNDQAVQMETVKLVQEAMETIGYKVPRNRRGPKRTSADQIRSGAIAVLVLGHNFSQIYDAGSGFAEALDGIESVLSENQLKMVVSTFEKPSNDTPLNIDPKSTGGLVILGKSQPLPTSVKILLKQIPGVRINTGWQSVKAECDQVNIDNSLVGELAADYLNNNGNRNVAYLSPYPKHTIHRERMETFAERAHALGMKVQCFVCKPEEVTTPYPTAENTRSLVCQLIRTVDLPTGIFVTHAIRANHAYGALREKGIEPMTDIDIVTADNVKFHVDQMVPKPAVIDTKMKLLGERAVEQLLWRIKHPEEKGRVKITIEPTLIKGESS